MKTIRILYRLHEIQLVSYKRCSVTESLTQDCGLRARLILVFVTSVCGGNLKGKVRRKDVTLLKVSEMR
jgi:hypothetical protein